LPSTNGGKFVLDTGALIEGSASWAKAVVIPLAAAINPLAKIMGAAAQNSARLLLIYIGVSPPKQNYTLLVRYLNTDYP
jgi:hypothetical protein